MKKKEVPQLKSDVEKTAKELFEMVVAFAKIAKTCFNNNTLPTEEEVSTFREIAKLAEEVKKHFTFTADRYQASLDMDRRILEDIDAGFTNLNQAMSLLKNKECFPRAEKVRIALIVYIPAKKAETLKKVLSCETIEKLLDILEIAGEDEDVRFLAKRREKELLEKKNSK